MIVEAFSAVGLQGLIRCRLVSAALAAFPITSQSSRVSERTGQPQIEGFSGDQVTSNVRRTDVLAPKEAGVFLTLRVRLLPLWQASNRCAFSTERGAQKSCDNSYAHRSRRLGSAQAGE